MPNQFVNFFLYNVFVSVAFSFTSIMLDFFEKIHIQELKREEDLLDVGDQSDEVVEAVEGSKWTSIKAVLLLILGTLIAAAFADPLVDVVDNFSDASGIPTFFISFIALPLATNSSEAVTAIIFASRDKRRTASLTFSEVCFLFPLYIR